MRDHLLGCYQFQAVEAEDDFIGWDLPPDHLAGMPSRMPTAGFALGVPRRVKWAAPSKSERRARERAREVHAFQTKDHTPESMRKDFPHEYDLHTMYADAARRSYNEQRKKWLYGDFEPSHFPDMYVDLARPGSDRTAVATIALMEQASKQIKSIRDACAENMQMSMDNRAALVARILADKQALRPGKKPLALDL